MKKTGLALACMVLILFINAQKPGAAIDVQHYLFSIALNDSSDIIQGTAVVDLQMLTESKTISLDLTSLNAEGKGMKVTSVAANNEQLSYTHTLDTLHISFSDNAKMGDHKKITIRYEGIPADGLIISTNKFKQRTFFADNWPNRAHNWLPCVDHPADKAAVDFIVTAPEHYQVISNGLQTEENNLPGNFKETHYHETVELPTKEMAIGVAAFAVNYAGDAAGIPIYSWVYPEEKEKGFYDYGLAKDILPFFIDHVGPYAYRKLANVESKTRFGGEENASAIFYSERSIKGDRTVEALLTHEIAHQWFGNSATEKDWQHIWLSEGFATYMTHLYLENKYGTDTLLKGMKKDREQVISFSKKRNTPVVDTSVTVNFMDLLNANSYQKGGWVLHMLRRKLGDSIFWKGIRKYMADFAGHNAGTEDFRHSMETVSGADLRPFFRQWLYTPGQPQLNISWKYNAKAKQVILVIGQIQAAPFEFPIQINIISGPDTVMHNLSVKEKITILKLPSATKPTQLLADPAVNLLFEGTIKEVK